MAIIKQKDPRCGITYVYESVSYWDKEKQQPRAKRKLIGRLDEETGEVIPTKGRGRKKESGKAEAPDDCAALKEQLAEKEQKIRSLEAEAGQLKEKLAAVTRLLKKALEQAGE